MALRSTFEFRYVAPEQRASAAVNERRLFFVGFETLTRGTIGMFFQIVDFKHSWEKSNPPLKDCDVAAEYKKTLIKIDSLVEEDVNDHFVQVAIRVYNKILSFPDCLALIMEARRPVKVGDMICNSVSAAQTTGREPAWQEEHLQQQPHDLGADLQEMRHA